MDRQKLQQIGSDIVAALDEVAKRHGVTITEGGGSFAATSGTVRLNVAEVAADGTVQTRERDDFERLAPMYGLEGHLDTTFEERGRTFTICGLRPGSPKYPVLARRDDGKIYKFPAGVVRAGILRRSTWNALSDPTRGS